MVRLHEVFPSGAGFVLVFDYMLSDLSSVLRNCDSPLTEVMQIIMYHQMLLYSYTFALRLFYQSVLSYGML